MSWSFLFLPENRKPVFAHTITGLHTVVMFLVLPFVMASNWMWLVLVIMGSTGYGVYTASLTSLGDRFSGQELINGSAAFAIVWVIGALFGSVAGGWAMSGFGPHGLPVSIAVVYLLLVVGLGIRGRYDTSKLRNSPRLNS